MSTFIIDQRMKKLPKLEKAVLIEGLPGIGNVGKIAVDFMVDELKAQKVLDIYSFSFPHSVFISEKNLVELPRVSLYHKKTGGRDLLFLGGDIQPVDEESCYEFCEEILGLCGKMGAKEIITLGGIGLSEDPSTPKVYLTGNSKDAVKRYADGTKAITKLYGIVGPIVGVSGLLVGLAGRRKIDSVSMLAETFGHPLFLGMKGSREILKMLSDKLSLNIDLKELDKEIENIERDLHKKTEDLESIRQQTAILKAEKENNYIG